MKILLEIKDEKVSFIMELLSNFKFVKAKPFFPANTDALEDLSGAVKELNQIKSGNKKAQTLSDFLDEL